MAVYREARKGASPDAGLEAALSAILVSREFLFRTEQAPAGPAGTPYRISDIEWASRISFLLWSSLPDEELLAAAASGELSQPESLQRQVHRMLVDPRAESLASHFAAQWLQIRSLEAFTPGAPAGKDDEHTETRTEVRSDDEIGAADEHDDGDENDDDSSKFGLPTDC